MNQTIVLSYQMLRKLVGLLGLAFPVILVVGSIIACDCTEIQSSISEYHHTLMRNIFVGVLCVVAFFLFAYNGYERKDKIAGELACLFALGVAFFPTTVDTPAPACIILPTLDNALVGKIHYISAASLFLDFAYFSLALFTRSDGKKTTEKRKRNKVYYACGYIMLACIALLAIYFLFLQDTFISRYKPVFYLETLALWAFGVSWLVKGELILEDKPTDPPTAFDVTGKTQSITPVGS